MKRIFVPYFLLSVFFLSTIVLSNNNQRKPKIVALVPGHNDSRFLPNCFRALAKYADAIVYLDDASTDNSVEIAQALAEECHIEQIICKKEWIRHEATDRNILLQLGRVIGGTHFIVLDADEMFTGNCIENNMLRQHILNLKPGEQLFLAWIQLWRSTDVYRFDNSVWTHNYKPFAFCDDSIALYGSRFINEARTPGTLEGTRWFMEGYTYGVLHFQFVNFENLLQKQAWYRCIERVYDEKRSIKSINAEYLPSIDETGLQTRPCPSEWFAGYQFLDYQATKEKELWRQNNVMNWFVTYGLERFAGLDIWATEWPFNEYILSNSSFLDSFVFRQQKEGVAREVGSNNTTSYNPALFFYTQKGWKQVTHFSSSSTVDLLVMHDGNLISTYINDLANVRTIAFSVDHITESIVQQLYQYGFALVPYNDNGYSYFLKMINK